MANTNCTSTQATASLAAALHEQGNVHLLQSHGYFAGERDAKIKPEFLGRFMVRDTQENEDGFCIVGDDLAALVREALEHLDIDLEDFLNVEYRKYVNDVAEGDPMEFDDWLAGSDIPEIVAAGQLLKGNVMKRGMTTDEFYSTLPTVERPVFDQSLGGFVIHAHPEIGVYPRSYEHCVQAFARSKGVALVDDEHVPPKGQGNEANYTPTELLVAQSNPGFDRADVQAVAGLRSSLLRRADGDVQHLAVNSAELELIRDALASHRELLASPTSADRDANGDGWADKQVQACDALLADLAAPAMARDDSPSPGM